MTDDSFLLTLSRNDNHDNYSMTVFPSSSLSWQMTVRQLYFKNLIIYNNDRMTVIFSNWLSIMTDDSMTVYFQ